MRIIQFLCPIPAVSEQLRALMLQQVNTWSRLSRLSTDPDYVTGCWDMEHWCEHLTTPGLWWADYGAIYDHLGDDGRAIADQMLGDGPLQGILRLAPLVQQLPDVRIEIVDVADPVAAGYLPAPEEPVA